MNKKNKKTLFRLGLLLMLLLGTMNAAAIQTVVAKWEFTTGYDSEKERHRDHLHPEHIRMGTHRQHLLE